MHDPVVRGIPSIWMEAFERIQRHKAHLWVYRTITNTIEGHVVKLGHLGLKHDGKRRRGKKGGGLDRDETGRRRVTV